tara:strand:- start:44 stop:568 length:525 start_codon:yes stop_codon:yes gene_type:complete
MAYISQEEKKEFAPAIKAVLKKYGMKGTLGIRHHSTLVCRITKGDLDIIGCNNKSTMQSTRFYDNNVYDLRGKMARLQEQYIDVNPHWIEENYRSDTRVISFLQELKTAMEGPRYFNEDDSMTDYFHRSHYTDIMVGSWCKPYECTNEQYDIQDDLDMLQGRIDDLEREDKMVA